MEKKFPKIVSHGVFNRKGVFVRIFGNLFETFFSMFFPCPEIFFGWIRDCCQSVISIPIILRLGP